MPEYLQDLYRRMPWTRPSRWTWQTVPTRRPEMLPAETPNPAFGWQPQQPSANIASTPQPTISLPTETPVSAPQTQLPAANVPPGWDEFMRALPGDTSYEEARQRWQAHRQAAPQFAADLPAPTPELAQRAQAMKDFITGQQAPATIPAATVANPVQSVPAPTGAGAFYGLPSQQGRGYRTGQTPAAIADAIARNPYQTPGGDRLAMMGYTPSQDPTLPALYVGETPAAPAGSQAQQEIAYSPEALAALEDRASALRSKYNIATGTPEGGWTRAGRYAYQKNLATRNQKLSERALTGGPASVAELRKSRAATKKTRQQRVTHRAAIRAQQRGRAVPTPTQAAIAQAIASPQENDNGTYLRDVAMYGPEAAAKLLVARTKQNIAEITKEGMVNQGVGRVAALQTPENMARAERAQQLAAISQRMDVAIEQANMPLYRRLQKEYQALIERTQPQSPAAYTAPTSETDDFAASTMAVTDQVALSGFPPTEQARDLSDLENATADDWDIAAKIGKKYNIDDETMRKYWSVTKGVYPTGATIIRGKKLNLYSPPKKRPAALLPGFFPSSSPISGLPTF